jgi:hypothetical protein
MPSAAAYKPLACRKNCSSGDFVVCLAWPSAQQLSLLQMMQEMFLLHSWGMQKHSARLLLVIDDYLLMLYQLFEKYAPKQRCNRILLFLLF